MSSFSGKYPPHFTSSSFRSVQRWRRFRKSFFHLTAFRLFPLPLSDLLSSAPRSRVQQIPSPGQAKLWESPAARRFLSIVPGALNILPSRPRLSNGQLGGGEGCGVVRGVSRCHGDRNVRRILKSDHCSAERRSRRPDPARSAQVEPLPSSGCVCEHQELYYELYNWRLTTGSGSSSSTVAAEGPSTLCCYKAVHGFFYGLCLARGVAERPIGIVAVSIYWGSIWAKATVAAPPVLAGMIVGPSESPKAFGSCHRTTSHSEGK